MTFGERVYKTRMQLNMSQEMLARELGISFATVNRWEKGHTEPSYKAKQLFEEFCKHNIIKGE